MSLYIRDVAPGLHPARAASLTQCFQKSISCGMPLFLENRSFVQLDRKIYLPFFFFFLSTGTPLDHWGAPARQMHGPR